MLNNIINIVKNNNPFRAKCTYPIDLIELLEGFRNNAYKCTEGKTTIGYGFNMDTKYSVIIWDMLNIEENYEFVKNGTQSISRNSAEKIALYQWKESELKAIARATKLKYNWDEFSEMKKAILTDIVFNTGSIRWWTKVFAKEGKDLLFEARRKQHEIDSRIAKIGHYFGEIKDVDEAIAIGLTETKYVV